MSIIIGLVSKKYALVASDGRETSLEVLDANNNILTKAVPMNDTLDKTFSLADNKIIGASAGLMSFSNLYIKDHLSNIFQSYCAGIKDISDIINIIEINFLVLLNNIPIQDIAIKHRVVDILFVFSEKGIKKIKTLRFKPDVNNTTIISFESETIPSLNKKLNDIELLFYLFGDDNAKLHAKKYLSQANSKNKIMPKQLLKAIIEKAILIGINNSNQHPFGDSNTCGGNISYKEL